ncbi:MAG: transglycosylase SLT domain-containing protein [Synergistaceae bacterium]|nr:transglycosylase SLT domain-containing protein [Synergistaceae bacterium]
MIFKNPRWKHAKPSNVSMFKVMILFFAAVMPFMVLPFFVASEFITMAVRRSAPAAAVHPAFSRYARRSLPPSAEIGYGYSVVTAMKEMGLGLDKFGEWAAEHPDSAIKHIKYMTAFMQRDVAGIALFIRKSNKRIDEKTAWREAAALVHYSAKYGVPAALTTAVAAAESSFNPDAVSPKGASGVMQVMWNIHNGLLRSNGIRAVPGKNPLADPEHAIAAGCLLLSRYIRASGSIQKAMDRYCGASSTAYRNKVNVNIAKFANHQALLFD